MVLAPPPSLQERSFRRFREPPRASSFREEDAAAQLIQPAGHVDDYAGREGVPEHRQLHEKLAAPVVANNGVVRVCDTSRGWTRRRLLVACFPGQNPMVLV